MAIDSTQGITKAQLAKEVWGSAFGTAFDYKVGNISDRAGRTTLVAAIVMGLFLLAFAIGLAYLASTPYPQGEAVMGLGMGSGLFGVIGLGITLGIGCYLIYHYRKKLSSAEALEWLKEEEKQLNRQNEDESASAERWRNELRDYGSDSCYILTVNPQQCLSHKEQKWDPYYSNSITQIKTAKLRYSSQVN